MIEHSERKIGQVWTETDHARLVAHLNAINRLAEGMARTANTVSHPAHYTFSAIEPLVVIESWGLGFHLGNVVKYVARAGKKSSETETEDLKKAQFYLDRKIALMEGKCSKS